MSMTLCLTAGQTCFQTVAGSPSSPGAFHDFATNNRRSTSCMVMSGMVTGEPRWGLSPSSSMTTGKGGSELLMVYVPSARASCGTLPNAVSSPDFRYFAAFQMLSLSSSAAGWRRGTASPPPSPYLRARC